MADHDEAAGAAEHLPAVRSSATPAPVDQAVELVRAVGFPTTAAAEMVTATMHATAQAVAAMWRPWLMGFPIAPPAAPEWSGPGVHVSYTHVELYWPTR